MALTFYYGSGSPYAWRVWMALEHKGIVYERKTLSFDEGDLKRPWYLALNPRGRVPVIDDDGFVLYESAAIVEYIEERWPQPRLFAQDVRKRAIERRIIREIHAYFVPAMEALVDQVLFTAEDQRSAEAIEKAVAALRSEAAFWERAIQGEYLAGALSAADFTLYPCAALIERVKTRAKDAIPVDLYGPKLTAWKQTMEDLAIVKKTWPPHWT